MRQLTPAGQQAVSAAAQRYGFSPQATLTMLEALIQGRGSMAQFNHPEFGGPGQWMRGGMAMVGDMFNDELKGRLDGLCSDLAKLLASEPRLFFGAARILQPSRPGASGQWWPLELGSPGSAGAQNGVRYAYFPAAHRLAIDLNGQVTIYDTLDHRIQGFSQQQSMGSGCLGFHSQHGVVNLASLPRISLERLTP